ncbi:MAG: hypothetical protein LBK08_08445 [Treponema sp.]|nr:hypothetical protein [Treponema sp.]
MLVRVVCGYFGFTAPARAAFLAPRGAHGGLKAACFCPVLRHFPGAGRALHFLDLQPLPGLLFLRPLAIFSFIVYAKLTFIIYFAFQRKYHFLFK